MFCQQFLNLNPTCYHYRNLALVLFGSKSRTTGTWTPQLYENFKNAVFGEYFKFLPLGNWYRFKTTPKIFCCENSSKSTATRGIQSFGLTEGPADVLSEKWPKFSCQKYGTYLMNTCWKFQRDISKGFWIIIDLLKNFVWHPPTLVQICLRCMYQGRRMSTKFFSKSMIVQKPFEISLWNFQHIFIIWVG